MSFLKPGLIEGSHNSEKFHTVSADVGAVPMTFEMGRIAKQASGAVWCRWGDTIVLTTVCKADPRDGIDFFPLTVEYVEKAYAAGRIPGGYFKREARPGSHEILNARITDRSIRPLFPEGYFNEVQVISTVVSHDGEHDADVMALCAASMALHVSEIPFAADAGPVAGVRVARENGKFVANPTLAQRAASDIDVIVSVTKDAITMVEGGCEQVTEADLIDALFFAHQEGQKVIAACHAMRKVMGKEKVAFSTPAVDEALFNQVREIAFAKGMKSAMVKTVKQDRYAALDKCKADTVEVLKGALGDDVYASKKKIISGYFSDLKSKTIRTHMIESKKRVDGRAFDEIRPIQNEVGALPRSHGSALFTRGETQALVTTTLGSKDDEQRIEDLTGTGFKQFMLHYNFPPFSVGEARALRGTSRREIGHGALAKRAVENMLPGADVFPYTVRVVSEITESNGSSSMATVCGATLSMLDAGVPLKAPVAGIAMGLVQEGKQFAILSDILGDEDHIGDMDFKVCGTENGVTAIQMDIKIDGLTRELLTQALDQARKGRLHILKKMTEAISEPRKELHAHAPRMSTLKINTDRIRDVIGPGGKMIREIVAKTGAKIDVEDDGTIKIFSVDGKGADAARQIIEDLTREAQVNMIYKALVRKVVEFGAFCELFPGTDGLLHISELSDKRVQNVADVVQEGDEVLVKVLSIDRDGKIRLSRRAAQGKEPGVIDPT